MSREKNNGRNAKGQFADGNRGGPGRPKRCVERDYLAALSETVTLDDWHAICQRAVEEAKGGDPKAREWLSRYCIGKEPQSLMDIAAKETRGLSSSDEIQQKSGREKKREQVVSQYTALLETFELDPIPGES